MLSNIFNKLNQHNYYVLYSTKYRKINKICTTRKQYYLIG